MENGAVFDNQAMHFEVLRGAVENTNEAFVTIDQQSRVVLFNKAAERLFGYRRGEVLGQDLGMLLSPMCESGHRQAVALDEVVEAVAAVVGEQPARQLDRA